MAEEKDLNIQDQLEEYQKCVNNILYWTAHYVKIIDSTSKQIINYQMWPHLVEFIRDCYRYDQLICLKSKQVGVSWTIALVSLHDCYSTGANVLEFSKGQDEASDLLEKSHFIYKQLPPFLRLKPDHEGTLLLSFTDTDSRIKALPSTKDAGIGETASRVWMDEHEFHDFARENYGHVRATVDAGANLGIVSTVDPERIDTNFKSLWYGAKAGTNNLHPIFLGAKVRPGRTDEVLAHIQRDYSLEWQFRANYPMTEEDALSPVAGRSFFDKDRLHAMLLECTDPIETRQGCIHIYHKPKLGVYYMAGVDAAEGAGGDYQVLWIEGQEGMQRELCAVIHSNDIRIDTFAYMSQQLLNDYFKPFVVGGADAYCKRFLESLIVLGYSVDKIHWSDREKGKIGLVETDKSQEEALLELEQAIRAGLRIRYKPAVLELFSYQLKSKGAKRIAPAEGAHNDLVMAAAKATFGFKHYQSTEAIGVEVFY